jgi:hypothetical protein
MELRNIFVIIFIYTQRKLRVFGNRVLKILGPKREEDGSWRQLHNDELHTLYSSPNLLG